MEVRISVDPATSREFAKELDEVVRSRILIEEVAKVAHQRWKDLARERLRTTLFAYLDAIQPPTITSDTTAEIMLQEPPGTPREWRGRAAIAERGLEPYDMRPVMLMVGRKGVQSTADGTVWRDIAIEHSGSKNRIAVGRQPLMQAFRGRLSSPSARRLMEKYERLAATAPPGTRFPGRDGVTAYDRGAGTEFLIFRRISSNSDGWQHPGVKGEFLQERVAEDMETLAPAVAERVLNTLLR